MKYIKYILVVFLCVFSFYVSDKAIIMVENMSPIMKKVKALNIETIEPVNAIIKDDTIIPGKNGKKLNERESYLKMNEFGTFNETFLIYDYIKPKVSLYDNLDKAIIKGNDINGVSLIIESDEHDEYLKNENIKYTKIIKDKDEIDDNTSYINANLDEDNFYKLNSYFKKNKINNKFCLVGKSNQNKCLEFKYFLIKPTLSISHSNLSSLKKEISGGDILYLTESLTMSELKLVINHIKYNNLEIIGLNEFVKE